MPSFAGSLLRSMVASGRKGESYGSENVRGRNLAGLRPPERLRRRPDYDVTKGVKEAQATGAVFKKADPALSRFFESSLGYAVFPTVTKGAAGIGGATGS